MLRYSKKADRIMKDKRETFKPIYDGIEKTLAELSVPLSFYSDMLKKGDDWSFIIKTHALIESAITHLLVTALKQPALQEIFPKLNISRKMDFVKSLGLLPPKHITFIKELSELRNKLVHNVHNINFNFTKYFAALEKDDKQKLNSVLNSIGGIIRDLIIHLDNNSSKNQFVHVVRENPRFVILQGSIRIIARIYLHKIGYKISDQDSNRVNKKSK